MRKMEYNKSYYEDHLHLQILFKHLYVYSRTNIPNIWRKKKDNDNKKVIYKLLLNISRERICIVSLLQSFYY